MQVEYLLHVQELLASHKSELLLAGATMQQKGERLRSRYMWQRNALMQTRHDLKQARKVSSYLNHKLLNQYCTFSLTSVLWLQSIHFIQGWLVDLTRATFMQFQIIKLDFEIVMWSSLVYCNLLFMDIWHEWAINMMRDHTQFESFGKFYGPSKWYAVVDRLWCLVGGLRL